MFSTQWQAMPSHLLNIEIDLEAEIQEPYHKCRCQPLKVQDLAQSPSLFNQEP